MKKKKIETIAQYKNDFTSFVLTPYSFSKKNKIVQLDLKQIFFFIVS